MPEEILSLAPRKKIYGSIASLVAILLGGPLAAAYIANRNSIVFRRSFKKLTIWIFSIIALLVLIFANLVYPMPRHFPLHYFVLNLFLNGLIQSQVSKDKLQAYQENGGKLSSIWKALALGILSLIFTFFVVVLSVFLSDLIYVYGGNSTDYPRITPLH